MGLFFTRSRAGGRQGKTTGSGDKRRAITLPVETLNKKSCIVCPLNEADLHNPKMKPSGPRRRIDVYLLGEAPGRTEDEEGEPFVGDAGQYIRERMPSDWRVRFGNVIQCRPPRNRDPSFMETECCRLRVLGDIEKTKPKIILGAGNVPLRWVLGMQNRGITEWRGRTIPIKVGTHTCWFMPVFHPSFLNRKLRYDKELGREVESPEGIAMYHDLRAVDKLLRRDDEPVVYEQSLDGIECIEGKTRKDLIRVKKWLRSLKKLKRVALDIETQDLRPYTDTAQLLSIAIGTYDEVCAFPIEHPMGWGKREQAIIHEELKEFLVESGIKICHNLNMEQEWLGVWYGKDVIRKAKWADTWAQAYVLDERKGMHNLDVLCRLRLGFNLKTDNLPMDRLSTVPLSDLLPYNGKDTKYTHKLYDIQMAELKKKENRSLLPVYERHVARNPSIAFLQMDGMCVDMDVAKRLQSDFGKMKKDLVARMRQLPEVKKLERMIRKPYDPEKEKQNHTLYRDILKREEIWVKERDNEPSKVSLKKSILATIPASETEHPSLLTSFRSVRTIKSTFLDSLERLLYPDGRLHPNVNDKFTSTSRFSMDEPNGQNFPKQQLPETRSIIIAPPKYRFLKADYGAIEYRAIAMLSRDKQVCNRLWGGQDIHREWAERFMDELGVRSVERSTMVYYSFSSRKQLEGRGRHNEKFIAQARQMIKNRWVFPKFFGAQDKACAKYMSIDLDDSEMMGELFWDTFSGVKRWQDRLVRNLEKKGYVELLTGRRRRVPMTRTEALDSPVQGTAAEIVNDAMRRLSNAGYQACINVHDELVIPLLTKGFENSVMEIVEIMVEPVFPFINVPLIVEAEAGPDWYNTEEIGEFSSTEFGHRRED